MTYIIVCKKSGQLANRLFQLSRLVAFSHQFNIKILYPVLDEYAEYFSHYHSTVIPTYPLPLRESKLPASLTVFRQLIYEAIYYLVRFLEVLHFNRSFIHQVVDTSRVTEVFTLDEKFYNHISKFRFVFFKGWSFKYNNYTDDSYREILSTTRFLDKYYIESDSFINSSKGEGMPLIGVHIRRGDYKYFEEGRYYYQIQNYIQWMSELQSVLGKRLTFIICSNEDLAENQHIFNSNLRIVFAPGHLITDMIILSKCNYIIGPPSTYSMWASFIGSVPLQMLRSNSHNISIGSFKPYKSSELQP